MDFKGTRMARRRKTVPLARLYLPVLVLAGVVAACSGGSESSNDHIATTTTTSTTVAPAETIVIYPCLTPFESWEPFSKLERGQLGCVEGQLDGRGFERLEDSGGSPAKELAYRAMFANIEVQRGIVLEGDAAYLGADGYRYRTIRAAGTYELSAFKDDPFDLQVEKPQLHISVTDPRFFEELDTVGTEKIAKMLGVTRQSVYALVVGDDFPRPIYTINGQQMWLLEDVEAGGRRTGRL